jgi:hypothetical protein
LRKKRALTPPLSGLFHLTELQLDRSRTTKNQYRHIEAVLLVIDILHNAIEVVEGPIDNPHHLARFEQRLGPGRLDALLDPLQDGSIRVRLIINDAMATVVALMVVGSVYAGSGQLFSLLVVDVSWFWFTLISYSLMELPFAMRYMRRHNMLE